jgi:hypothetical protein
LEESIENPNSESTKKARHVKSKVQSMLIIFFDITGVVYKELIMAGQTLTSAYHCNVLCPECRQQINCLLHHNNMTVVSQSPYFSPFPRLQIKLKCRHFDITEVIEAELQAVLNALTEHDFPRCILKMAEALGMVHTC